MSNTYPPALGIDFGRVIISSVKDDGRADTAFLQGSTKEAMQTPPNERAFEVIKELVEAFEGRVWIVSKAGKRIQQRTRQWLHTHKFYEQTGIPKEHLRFCIKRHQKAIHCKELGITHFIDDRLQVLSHLKDCVPNLYVYGPQKGRIHESWLTHVHDWNDVEAALL
ncbi:MAG TPA: hypothetical protein DCE42_25660 [Myxococcales bacterium]|nr:hypothetical protein [Deltaproteobacteria bacterium]MBU51972.1 hypothetical protein [Deltaproteobacteria bacterium]HAA58176.1 hypothetical protein [Myxococcales bacterium]